MKLKDFPTIVTTEVTICKGTPLGKHNEILAEYLVWGQENYYCPHTREEVMKYADILWSTILEEYGECEVLAIVANTDCETRDHDTWIYVRGGHS